MRTIGIVNRIFELTMKPSKNIKNKVTTETTIQHYFKIAPKECVEEKGCTASESKSAYIQILKDKLMSKNFFPFPRYI